MPGSDRSLPPAGTDRGSERHARLGSRGDTGVVSDRRLAPASSRRGDVHGRPLGRSGMRGPRAGALSTKPLQKAAFLLPPPDTVEHLLLKEGVEAGLAGGNARKQRVSNGSVTGGPSSRRFWGQVLGRDLLGVLPSKATSSCSRDGVGVADPDTALAVADRLVRDDLVQTLLTCASAVSGRYRDSFSRARRSSRAGR